MRLERLRDLPDLAATYPTPHDHRLYGRGHDLRVQITIALARSFVDPSAVVADLSCGNGAIASALTPTPILGDLAPGWPITGPIEQTVETVGGVDAWVLSETLEHVEHPGDLLPAIRARSERLILSTPLCAWGDTNLEHLWAWDREAVEVALMVADWTVEAFASLDSRPFGEPYLYGIWVAK